MKLEEIHDQAVWDAFVASQRWASFQQSWNWGEFQKTQGHLVKRFFFEDGAAQYIYYKKRFSGYWFCPRGPVGTVDLVGGQSILPLRPRPLFYRFEPPVTSGHRMPSNARRTHAMSPAATILMDLTKSEDELLAAMHSKTRYNIRVAQK
ncbi:aminoacyltransferase, partial [Candidatus Uhrbacteria bacterium]|nr:aminoacyltransferase [Candidatus Uhrbacteria bacterium]